MDGVQEVKEDFNPNEEPKAESDDAESWTFIDDKDKSSPNSPNKAPIITLNR